MTSARRGGWNFALQRAVEHARRLGRPLVVLERLCSAYPFASDRAHAFVLAGMADNHAAFASSPVTYLPYVERAPGEGRGLLESLAETACVVVTDEFPTFVLPRMVAAAAGRLQVLLEAVDGNGLLPAAVTDAVYPSAFAFRRFLQAELPAHLTQGPSADPLAGVVLPRVGTFPARILDRWPVAGPDLLGVSPAALAALPIDHTVAAVAGIRGGSAAGRATLAGFVARRLAKYEEQRNQPGVSGTSGLSPYLHFGHVSAHEVFAAVAAGEGWHEDKLAARASGNRAGWWGMSRSAEAFLDQLVTWRELGFNFAFKREDVATFDSLPGWARQTLAAHAADPRPYTYTRRQLAAAETHDPIWNAAQRQLVGEGVIHNYLRMLWGKKILEWSASPEEAADTMIELNDRLALDGRDPNSYSGIFWCLGRYDRPWGPERTIFGTVRYMSSANTARKLHLDDYLRQWGPSGPLSRP
jgi:deoxyribodipyrimidine photo-lyase